MAWTDRFFEADPKPAPKPKPAEQPHAIPAMASLPHDVIPRLTPSHNDVDGSTAYGKLHDETDFDKTDAGRSLKKYLDPLASLSLDEHSKMKAAAAQAQAQDGLTSEKFLATFDTLKRSLLDEQSRFKDFIAARTTKEIDGRQTKIDDFKKQIEDASQKVIQLTTELAQERGKIDHANSDFNSAFATRTEELDQQKTHFASLLQ
jgi:hypothetical protein